jgi:hypothetical protein
MPTLIRPAREKEGRGILPRPSVSPVAGVWTAGTSTRSDRNAYEILTGT